MKIKLINHHLSNTIILIMIVNGEEEKIIDIIKDNYRPGKQLSDKNNCLL